MNTVKSVHVIKFNHSNDLIGSEVIFVKNRNEPIQKPNGFVNGLTPLGMGMLLNFYVVSHNARHSGTVCCLRVYHTGDHRTTHENLKDILHMNSSTLVLSLAAKYEENILENLPKGASLHKLLGATLYFSPQRSVIEPPPLYVAPNLGQDDPADQGIQGPAQVIP